jgi:type II secretory pathway component PulK
MNSLLTRVNRLIRLRERGGRTFVMRDGSRRTMSRTQASQAFHDAMCGIDTPDARVVLQAVTDDSGGNMLQLIWAVRNPIDTEARD